MIKVTDKNFWINPILKSNIDTLILNAQNDFDFMILVSGSGNVRTGKSVFATQLAYYITHNLGQKFTIDNNICFSAQDLMTKALANKKPTAFVYDEAREALDSKKLWDAMTRTLLDFFAECGLLNHFLIIVLPDYFELPRSVAITRSVALINVFYTYKPSRSKVATGDIPKGTEYLKFMRGKYHFYNRHNKKNLYIFGKREQDYDKGRPNFSGDFMNFWVMDKEEYTKKKVKFIKRSRSQDYGGQRFKIQRDYLIQYLYNNIKIGTKKMIGLMTRTGEPIGERGIQKICKEVREREKIFSQKPETAQPNSILILTKKKGKKQTTKDRETLTKENNII